MKQGEWTDYFCATGKRKGMVRGGGIRYKGEEGQARRPLVRARADAHKLRGERNEENKNAAGNDWDDAGGDGGEGE